MVYENGFVLTILKGLNLFAQINNEALKELSLLFEERIFIQGETIFEEDSIGNTMMVIASGEVRVSQRTDPNSEEALVVLKKGDVFGEMALLDNLPRSATTISHTNAVIFEISRKKFLDYIKNDPQNGILILLKLSKVMSERLREANTKLKAFVNLSQWI